MDLSIKVITTYHKDGIRSVCENKHRREGPVNVLSSRDRAYINSTDTNVVIDTEKTLNVQLPTDPFPGFWCSIMSTLGDHKIVSDKYPINQQFGEYPIFERRRVNILWSESTHSWIVD